GALLDIRPEKGKRDAAFEHGREVSARDLPHGFISRLHRVAGTGDLPAVEHEPAQSTADTALAFGEERRATTEVALVETHDPREARLQRRDARPEFVAVQRQPCFEAEGVARAEPGGADPGIEEKPPNGRRDRGRDVELDAVLTGVPGSGDPARFAGGRDRPGGEPGRVPPRGAQAG